MIIEEFSVRLKKAMNLNQMTQAELSRKSGLDKSLISNYLSGKYKAKQDKLYIIAKILDVNEAWLMGYDVSMDREWLKDSEIDNATLINNFYIEDDSKNIKIPILGKIPAGVPIEAIEDIDGYVEVSKSIVKDPYNLFALRISGDSMNPEYKTNDIVIIKKQFEFNSGDDCVVMVNGNDATFKRIIKQEDSIILKPLNNNYEPTFFSKKDIIDRPVKIIGVAIEVRRKLKGGV